MAIGGKIVGLDIARTVAIVLAMLNHSFIATNVWTEYFADKPYISFVVRLATPMFIILFGALLEIVYRNRAERDGMQSVTARLFDRALLCWLLYTLTVITLFLIGKISAEGAFLGALLVGKIPLSDILRYYTILFVIAPALLAMRLRWGLAPLCIASTAILLLHPLFVLLPAPPHKFAHYVPARLADLALGIGDAVTGPSVLHSLFFVAVGMIIGRLLIDDRSKDPAVRKSVDRKFLMLGAALSAGTLTTYFLGPEKVSIESVAGMALRNANHPFYFFSGALAATVVIALCRSVRHVGSGPLRPTMLGQRSLFTFSAGNAFLLSVSRDYRLDTIHLIGLSIIFFLIVVGMAAIYDVFMQPDARTSSRAFVRIGSRCWRAIIDPVNHLLHTTALSLASHVFSQPPFGRSREVQHN